MSWEDILKAEITEEEVPKNIIRNKLLGLGKKYFIDDITNSEYWSTINYNRGRGRFSIEEFNKALFQRWKNNGKQKLTKNDIHEVEKVIQSGGYRPNRQPTQISGGGVMGGNDYGWS